MCFPPFLKSLTHDRIHVLYVSTQTAVLDAFTQLWRLELEEVQEAVRAYPPLLTFDLDRVIKPLHAFLEKNVLKV